MEQLAEDMELWSSVPFAALRTVRLGWPEALFTFVIALVAGLDVLFHVHRSISHSAIVLLIIVLPLLALSRNHETIQRFTLLARSQRTRAMS